jgi:hypothetical protein
MALLTSIFRLVITLGAIGPTLSRQKLPTLRTIYALIVSRPAARFTTHVTSRAHSFIAIVPSGARGTTFSTLQLQTGYALAAVGLGDAFAAGVQAGFAQTRSFVMEEAFITDGDAPRPLEDQGAGAGETSVFGGAVAGLASRVARLAQAAVEILIDVAAVAPVRHAPPLRVDLPVLQTRYASGLVTFRTSRGALYTLVLVRIRIVMSRTFLYATTFVPEALLTARDALGTVRTLARFARLVAGGARVVLRFVRVRGAGGEAFVLIEQEVVVATRAVVGAVLAAPAVRLTRRASLHRIVFEITFGTLLQTNIQIDNSHMTWGTRKATFLVWTGARFARLMTGLTNALGIGVAPRWTRTDASPVHPLVLAGYTLGGALAEAPLIVALFITVLFGLFVVVDVVVVVANLRLFPVERTNRLFGFGTRERVDVLEVVEPFEGFAVEEIVVGDGSHRFRYRGKSESVERRLPRTRLRPASRSHSYGIHGSSVEYQLPLFQNTRLVDVPVSRVYYLQGPAPLGSLPPKVHAQERPVVEIRTDHVSGPLEQQSRSGAHRRDQHNPEVPPREESQRDLALDVLQEVHLVQRIAASVHVHVEIESGTVRGIDLPIFNQFLRLADVLRWHRRPLLGQRDQRAGVHQTVAELVRHFSAHAVRYPAALLLEGRRSRRQHHQVLHVPPG